MQRGVLELMYDECRTEMWVIDPGALCDTKLWLGRVGRIPSSTELDEYELAGTGPMDVLMSMCLNARACRLWWFDELGAEYWSRNKGDAFTCKGDTLTKMVFSSTNLSNSSIFVYPYHTLSIPECDISSSTSPNQDKDIPDTHNPLSIYSDKHIVDQSTIRTVLSSPPFVREVPEITESKRRMFSFDRFIDLSDHPDASTVAPEVRGPDTTVPTMPQPPSMAYLAWLAFPERDTSPRGCLCTSLPRTAVLTSQSFSMDIPCRGDGLRNPLPRLCAVTAEGMGPLAGVPFTMMERI